MRLTLLLGLSLAIHLIIFSSFSPSEKNHVFINPPSQEGSIYVVAIKHQANSPTPPRKTSSNKIHDLKKASKPNLTTKNKTSKENTNTDINRSITDKSNQTALITKIKSKFTKHFKYPLLARRKGWQGKVLLTLHVNNAGFINNIKVKSSSGYEILDNAAKRSLAKIEQIKISANMDLPLTTYLQLPVIYKLTEG